jgi:uncharacterized protein (TIGR00369 family)
VSKPERLSPARRVLGYEQVSLDPEAGTAETSYDAVEDFTNSAGIIQGGFLAAMLDSVMGTALMAALEPGTFTPTLDLHVSYLRPARVGRIRAQGRVRHRGGSIGFVEGELRDEAGELLATGSATMKIRRPRTRTRPEPPLP